MKNLTPHGLTIFCGEGREPIVLPSEGEARVEVQRVDDTPIVVGNVVIPTYHTEFGRVTGLPEDTGEILIVSLAVRQALPQRTDLYSPGELVRDEKGRVVGCRGLDHYNTKLAANRMTGQDLRDQITDKHGLGDGRWSYCDEIVTLVEEELQKAGIKYEYIHAVGHNDYLALLDDDSQFDWDGLAVKMTDLGWLPNSPWGFWG
jgi:hypothetical protein